MAEDKDNKKPFLTVNHFQAKMPRYIKELQSKCKHNNIDYINNEAILELFCLDCGSILFTLIK